MNKPGVKQPLISREWADIVNTLLKEKGLALDTTFVDPMGDMKECVQIQVRKVGGKTVKKPLLIHIEE